MADLKKIYDKFSDINIEILSYKMPKEHKAITIELNGEYTVFLNCKNIPTEDDEFSILAHEYGHCITGSTHKLGSDMALICKHEYRANRAAILNFCPLDDIIRAFNAGCDTIFSISEFLDIPEPFIQKALKYYKCMNLI